MFPPNVSSVPKGLSLEYLFCTSMKFLFPLYHTLLTILESLRLVVVLLKEIMG